MWRKATCYMSATFAAFVVASSLAPLTGAQAETLTLNGGIGGFPIISNNTTFGAPPQQPPTGTMFLGINQGGASFDGFTGTYRFAGQSTSIAIGGYDPASQTFTLGPNTSILSGPFMNTLQGGVLNPMFGANGDLQGTVTFSSIQDNTPRAGGVQATLIGALTVTSSSGILAGGYPAGFTTAFDVPIGITGGAGTAVSPFCTTVACAVNLTPPNQFSSAANTSFGSAAIGALAPVPLPPAIYLFGSVLGGAFWLGRRKRSAVSSLGTT